MSGWGPPRAAGALQAPLVAQLLLDLPHLRLDPVLGRRGHGRGPRRRDVLLALLDEWLSRKRPVAGTDRRCCATSGVHTRVAAEGTARWAGLRLHGDSGSVGS